MKRLPWWAETIVCVSIVLGTAIALVFLCELQGC